MTGDEIGRARLAETLLRRDKRREPDDLEIEAPGVRRRVEGGASSSSGQTATAPEFVPVAMPVDVPYVVDMAADMDIEALLEKQVEELGMLMTALCQTETHVAEIFSPGRFTVRARCFDLRSGTAMDLRTGYDFNSDKQGCVTMNSSACKRSPDCAQLSWTTKTRDSRGNIIKTRFDVPALKTKHSRCDIIKTRFDVSHLRGQLVVFHDDRRTWERARSYSSIH